MCSDNRSTRAVDFKRGGVGPHGHSRASVSYSTRRGKANCGVKCGGASCLLSITCNVTRKMSSSSTSRLDDDARRALGRRPGPPPPKVSLQTRIMLTTDPIGGLTFRPVLDVSCTYRLTTLAQEQGTFDHHTTKSHSKRCTRLPIWRQAVSTTHHFQRKAVTCPRRGSERINGISETTLSPPRQARE